MQLALELAFESVREEDEAGGEERSPEFSDDALATSFAIRHKDELRYVAAWGRWFLYDGMCWREEKEFYNDGGAFKITCRDQRGLMVTIGPGVTVGLMLLTW